MHPSAASAELSVSAQMLSGVFESCLMSLGDLQYEEQIFLASRNAIELTRIVSEAVDSPDLSRDAIREVQAFCEAALAQIEKRAD